MATRLTSTLYQVFDDEGNPGNGYLLYFYATGTTTLKDTYSDEALTVANANPVVADAAGRFGDIFGATKDGYKVILATDAAVTVETEDPVDSITYNINSFDPRPAQHWGTTTNTADAYRIEPDTSITAYSDDLIFTIQAHLDNNAGCTLAVFEEGTTSTYLAALDMMKYDNNGAKTALEALDIQAGQTYFLRIDGTDAVVLNPGIEQYTKTNDLLINNELTIASNAVTIATGAVAYTGGYMILDGEAAADDDLDTISGGSEGDIVIISQANDARDITIKHGADNIQLASDSDIILSTTEDKVILQYDGSNWVELSKATENLKTIELVTSVTASASATVELLWTNDSDLLNYYITFESIAPANDSVRLYMQVSLDGGSTWKSGASDYTFSVKVIPSTGAESAYLEEDETFISLTDDTAGLELGNAANESFVGRLDFLNPNSSTYKRFIGTGNYASDNVPFLVGAIINAVYKGSTTAINGIQFYMSAGNIASGEFKLYRY